MKVNRISQEALDKLIQAQVSESVQCVVKFYSNGCNYCHNLQEQYENLAETHPNAHFFAFNIDDDPSYQNRLGFNGVPTIALIDIAPPKARIKIMSEPQDPDELTWYLPEAIDKFMKENIK
jgi:thioredoxin-like negative regulator of GroEL